MRGGSVLSVGQSKLRCNPAHCDFTVSGVKERVSIHAEQDALSRCGDAKGAILYIARIGRGGDIALAKPCLSCQKKLLDAGVKRVYYSVNNNAFDVWPPE